MLFCNDWPQQSDFNLWNWGLQQSWPFLATSVWCLDSGTTCLLMPSNYHALGKSGVHDLAGCLAGQLTADAQRLFVCSYTYWVRRNAKSPIDPPPLALSLQVRLQVGVYIVFLIDWLSVFSHEQLLVLRLEDHASNRKYTMHKVFDFLHLGERGLLTHNLICNCSPWSMQNTSAKTISPLSWLTPVAERDY